MEKDDIYYIKKAINEAKKAYELNEIPVGVVIVQNGKIIAKAHNERDTKQIVTKHAEIIAIEKANKKINNWRLLDATLYTTLEPCKMCEEIIKESKIKDVVYCAKNQNNKTNYKQINDQNIISYCEELIRRKFDEIRIK